MLTRGVVFVALFAQAMAGSRILLQDERGLLPKVQALTQVDECNNSYLTLKALSDQNANATTILENGVALNKLQIENLTERISINSATLVRTSVNISELDIQARALAQDLGLVNNDMVGYSQSNALLQSEINALLNIVTLEETAMILPVEGRVISPNDTLTAVQDCPSGYRPIKVECAITGLDQASFVEEGTSTALSQAPESSAIKQSIQGTTGVCSYQIYYFDSSRVQTNIAFVEAGETTLPPVTVTATTTCRVA
jgi:hypothetical protein